jgi:hypothetical protein
MTVLEELKAMAARPCLSRGEAAAIRMAIVLLGGDSPEMTWDEFEWLPGKILTELHHGRLSLKTPDWRRES